MFKRATVRGWVACACRHVTVWVTAGRQPLGCNGCHFATRPVPPSLYHTPVHNHLLNIPAGHSWASLTPHLLYPSDASMLRYASSITPQQLCTASPPRTLLLPPWHPTPYTVPLTAHALHIPLFPSRLTLCLLSPAALPWLVHWVALAAADVAFAALGQGPVTLVVTSLAGALAGFAALYGCLRTLHPRMVHISNAEAAAAKARAVAKGAAGAKAAGGGEGAHAKGGLLVRKGVCGTWDWSALLVSQSV